MIKECLYGANINLIIKTLLCEKIPISKDTFVVNSDIEIVILCKLGDEKVLDERSVRVR